MMKAEDIIDMHKARTDAVRSRQYESFCQFVGLNKDGTTYVPRKMDVKTEDSLNMMGCPYNKGIGYHSHMRIDGIPCDLVDFSPAIVYDGRWQRYKMDYCKCKEILVSIWSRNMSSAETGVGFKGEPGDKVALAVKFDGCRVVTTASDYGDMTILQFTDDDGYKYKWLQRNFTENTVLSFVQSHCKDGSMVVCGTIKGHYVRNAQKFTRLSRCEVTANDGTTLAGYSSRRVNASAAAGCKKRGRTDLNKGEAV